MPRDNKYTVPVYTDDEREFRKSVLKDLPINSTIYYQGPSSSLRGFLYVKKGDSSRKMIVWLYGGGKTSRQRLNYENISCVELERHESTTKKLIGEDYVK